MNSLFRNPIDQSQLQHLLSKERKNRDGYVFRAEDPLWKLNNSRIQIKVASAASAFDENVRPYFRLVLATYAEQKAGTTVLTVVQTFRRWAAYFPQADPLSESDFLTYAAYLDRNRENEASRIRGFLRYWYDLGYLGVTKELLTAIDDLRFYGGDRFTAVRTMDPFKGPYTPLESDAILDHLHNALSTDLIDESDFFLVYLVYITGSRAAQIFQLVFSDFQLERGKHLVYMPRAKQRNVSFRGEATKQKVNEDLFLALELHRRKVIEQLQIENPELIEKLPVFPNFTKFEESPVTDKTDVTQDHHIDAETLKARIVAIGKRINAYSERTGAPIHLTAKRLRSTMGTDMARDGAGLAAIAFRLDHSDLQHVDHYVQSQPEFAAVIDRAVGSMLAPLAQAFQGMIVRDESEAVRGDDATSRIRTEDGTSNIGNCGSFGFCGANAPVSCYTCNRFQPWVDAPHKEVMDALLAERDYVIDVTGDETIARQLDRSILAVADVIQQCEAMRGEQ